jgi:hypothetical protein
MLNVPGTLVLTLMTSNETGTTTTIQRRATKTAKPKILSKDAVTPGHDDVHRPTRTPGLDHRGKTIPNEERIKRLLEFVQRQISAKLLTKRCREQESPQQ